jgi:acylphosphatase
LIKHYNIRVTGRVQGVGFRYSARSVARYHNIKGFVRNEPDGSVYIEAEGSEENLKEFIQWCKSGPVGGGIDETIVSEGNIRNFNAFEVRFS